MKSFIIWMTISIPEIWIVNLLNNWAKPITLQSNQIEIAKQMRTPNSPILANVLESSQYYLKPKFSSHWFILDQDILLFSPGIILRFLFYVISYFLETSRLHYGNKCWPRKFDFQTLVGPCIHLSLSIHGVIQGVGLSLWVLHKIHDSRFLFCTHSMHRYFERK